MFNLVCSNNVEDESGEVVFRLKTTSLSTTLKTIMVTPGGKEVGACQKAGFFNNTTGYITEEQQGG